MVNWKWNTILYLTGELQIITVIIICLFCFLYSWSQTFICCSNLLAIANNFCFPFDVHDVAMHERKYDLLKLESDLSLNRVWNTGTCNIPGETEKLTGSVKLTCGRHLRNRQFILFLSFSITFPISWPRPTKWSIDRSRDRVISVFNSSRHYITPPPRPEDYSSVEGLKSRSVWPRRIAQELIREMGCLIFFFLFSGTTTSRTGFDYWSTTNSSELTWTRTYDWIQYGVTAADVIQTSRDYAREWSVDRWENIFLNYFYRGIVAKSKKKLIQNFPRINRTGEEVGNTGP